MTAEAQLALIAVLARFVESLPLLITSLGGVIMAIIAYRNQVTKETVKQVEAKAEVAQAEVTYKLDQIHTQTNSNLTVANDNLTAANEKIALLADLVGELKTSLGRNTVYIPEVTEVPEVVASKPSVKKPAKKAKK